MTCILSACKSHWDCRRCIGLRGSLFNIPYCYIVWQIMDFLFKIMVALVRSVRVVVMHFKCTLIVHAIFCFMSETVDKWHTIYMNCYTIMIRILINEGALKPLNADCRIHTVWDLKKRKYLEFLLVVNFIFFSWIKIVWCLVKFQCTI